MTATTPIKQATQLVKRAIIEGHPELFLTTRNHDVAGQKINVHLADGTYAATLNWELCSWVDYVIIDRLQDLLDEHELEFDIELLNSYEIGFLAV